MKANESAERDYYFDNVKFLLIALVVIGHAIRPFVDQSEWMMALYLTIFTFHMPLFILIAGYFSKNIHRQDQAQKAIRTILIPYVLFQVLYSVFAALPREFSDFSLSVLDPYWLMWFLLSLFTWRVILPYFIQLKYPVLTSVLLAVLAGYMDGADSLLGLARTAAFFPFFIAGYYLERHHFNFLFTRGRRWLAVGGMVVLPALMHWFQYHSLVLDLDWRRWLYYSFPYEELGQTEWYAGGYRILTFALAIFASLCFLALVPERKTFISRLGSRSLYVYLWHGFFIKTFKAFEPEEHLQTFFQHGLVILAAIGLTFFLSSDWVYKVTRPLVQPRLSWIFSSSKKGDEEKRSKTG
ncbi:fucose 4-O-acetylase-like acetyltransferase [Melghirimyces profundicolus]|uniref:Fucose 4-O-acetylase-like acetyltransferase n=1 Tax=Melghirimyces profundicolus TaxID=1242148 RepID=A0A2T6BGI7_9BACL|nr:acyltransferase family protein [Melghirimyces profundicolus]PTX55166.1 fucose 4-O-acetylase-like acetyltransferase [Melghirimyces profundicolus]